MNSLGVQKPHVKRPQLPWPPWVTSTSNVAVARRLTECCAKARRLRETLKELKNYEDLKVVGGCEKKTSAGNQISRLKKYLKQCEDAVATLTNFAEKHNIKDMTRSDEDGKWNVFSTGSNVGTTYYAPWGEDDPAPPWR